MKRGSGKITWGHLGKMKTYKHALQTERPTFSPQDRARIVAQKMKPYDSVEAAEKAKVIFAGAAYLSGDTPTPSPSITPTITPTNTPTSTPTPTPTITPSASPAPPFDADAASYLSAVLSAGGSLDSTISGATNTLFSDLKTAGLYSKMLAFYPTLGGVSGSHALNGKRTGSAYDMTFFGGWTHDSNGMKGNGTNTYGIFNISGGTLPSTNSHISVYGNLGGLTSSGYDLSINLNNQTGKVSQIIFDIGGNGYYEYNGYSAVAGGDTDDFIIISRNAAGTETIRAKDEIALTDKTEPCNDIDNTREWFLGAEQGPNGAKLASTQNRYCWVGFGDKLTDAELLTYQSIVNTFQTTLGRNSY